MSSDHGIEHEHEHRHKIEPDTKVRHTHPHQHSTLAASYEDEGAPYHRTHWHSPAQRNELRAAGEG